MGMEQTAVIPVHEDYRCDLCGKGFMRPTGIVLTSNPVQYPHRCNHCDAHMNFPERYPSIKYIRQGD